MHMLFLFLLSTDFRVIMCIEIAGRRKKNERKKGNLRNWHSSKSKTRYLQVDRCGCQKERHFMEWFWDFCENDRHNQKGKREGNYLQKQLKWTLHIYGELFMPDKFILFRVWIKLEDGGSRGNINFDYSKLLNSMSQGILIKI